MDDYCFAPEEIAIVKNYDMYDCIVAYDSNFIFVSLLLLLSAELYFNARLILNEGSCIK